MSKPKKQKLWQVIRAGESDEVLQQVAEYLIGKYPTRKCRILETLQQ